MIGIAAEGSNGTRAGLGFSSSLLATMTHLGEPGVGVGRGSEPSFQVGPPAEGTQASAAPTVDEKPVQLRVPTPRYTEAAHANKVEAL